MSKITLTVNNWDKYNPRKDIKNPSWFAFSNRMIEDEDIFELSGVEFKAWVYVLSKASQKNSDTVEIDSKHFSRICGAPIDSMTTMLVKMSNNITVHVRDESVRICTGSSLTQNVDVTRQTDKQTGQDKQDKTEQECVVVTDSVTPRPDKIDLIFNQFNELAKSHGMHKIKILNTDRKKRLTKAVKQVGDDLEIWHKIFIVAGSKGFVGKDGREWKPDFDYIFRNENYVKFSESDYPKKSIGVVTEHALDQIQNSPYKTGGN